MKALLLALAMFITTAHASYVDLSEGNVVAKAMCQRNGKQFLCVIVTHKDLTYAVIIDQKGEYEIYLQEGDELKLIWARDMI